MAEPGGFSCWCAGVCRSLLADRVPSRALALIGAGLIAAFFHGWIVQSSGKSIRLPEDIPPPQPIERADRGPAIANSGDPDPGANDPGLMGQPDDGPDQGTTDDPSITQGGSPTDDPTTEIPDDDPLAIDLHRRCRRAFHGTGQKCGLTLLLA